LRPPAFALERLRDIDPEHMIHESIKPGPGGSVGLMPISMQLFGRRAALIPPPRKHRHRTYGALAPSSPLRAAVTALAQPTEGIVLAPADFTIAASRRATGGDSRRAGPSPGSTLWRLLQSNFTADH